MGRDERPGKLTGGGGPDATPPPPRPAELPPTPRFEPTKAAEIRRFVGHDKAVGRLYDYDNDAGGRPVGDLIYSGASGPGATGPGLTGQWKYLESLTQHTEGHAAAIMRRDGISDGVLYLNMHPCRPPAGCHENIKKAIPAGSRLTVWVVNADGSVLRRRYTGTGEAVEQ